MNDYYDLQEDVAPDTKVRAVDLNNLDQIIGKAFDKLPARAALFSESVGYQVDTGTKNALAFTVPAPVLQLVDGMRFRVKLANPITGPATGTVGTLGTFPIRKPDGSNITTEVVAGQVLDLTYIGGVLQANVGVINPVAASGLPTTGGTMTGPLNMAKGDPVASAATLDLQNVTGNLVHVTGNTAIAAVNLAVGATRQVIFDGVLTLTHGANLQLPGAANILTAAGDRMTVCGDAAGMAIVTGYQRANGQPVNYTPQTGKKGRVFGTDGAKADWVPNAPGIITANGTLDYGSYMFAGNYAVTLPDLTPGLPLLLTVPGNASAGMFPATVATSDGWTITTSYAAGTQMTIMPLRWDTPHGWWGSLGMAPPKVTTKALGTTGSNLFIQSSIQLSANCLVLAIADTAVNTIALVCVDPATGNVGNVITIAAAGGANSYQNSLFKIGAAGFAYAYNNGSNAATAIACTVNGLAITNGAPVALSATGKLIETPVLMPGTSTLVAVFSISNSSQDMLPFTVAGTGITLGVVTGSGAASSSVNTRLSVLSANSLLTTFSTSGGTNNVQRQARVFTLSGVGAGLTLTPAQSAIPSPSGTMYGNTTGNVDMLVPFGNGIFLYGCKDSTTTTNIDWWLITVSSNTPAWSSAPVVTTATMPNNGPSFNVNLAYTGRGVNPAAQSRWFYPIDASHLLVNLYGTFYIASFLGSTLTMTSQGATGHQTFLTDLAGTSLYGTQVSGGSTYNKISVTAAAATLVAPAIAAWPSSIFNDNLNDSAVNYGGNWYKWSGLPPAAMPLAADKYLNLTGDNLNTYGSFA